MAGAPSEGRSIEIAARRLEARRETARRPPNHERIVGALERVDPATARELRAMVGITS